MLVAEKLEILGRDAQFDVCGQVCGFRPRPSPLDFIHHAHIPGQGTIALFKVLLTNVCLNDCAYCINQVSLDRPRHSFKPDELARTFMDLHQKRLVRGLFLSSGIAGRASNSQEAMIETVEILRRRYDFRDYIHLKILPGASFDCVEEACKLADRVSVNIEAPTSVHLARISTKKDLQKDIVERMRWVKKITTARAGVVTSGQTTQFVVGASGETDADILRTAHNLYGEIGLRRVYFSAYRPVSTSSRLEGVPAAPPMRQHRLYQADWLLRVYNFSNAEVELALNESGNLPLKRDPKHAIAQRQPWLYPVDLNTATFEELIRVPGIGPISARKIITARKQHSIYSLQQLKKMRVPTMRAAPFLCFQGMLDWEKSAIDCVVGYQELMV